MNKIILPFEIEFNYNQSHINTLMERLSNGTIGYDKNSTSDVRLLELCLCLFPIMPIIVRCDTKFNLQKRDNFVEPGWSVYKGSGLIKTIQEYILEDKPIDGLEVCTEYNGKRYSELPRYIQRRIEETIIHVYIDNSYTNTDNNEVVKLYTDVMSTIM